MSKLKYELELVVVRGVGPFPFDMLRYDHCVPAIEFDSGEMGHAHYQSDRCVILKRYAGQPGTWTPDRWKSFGWVLVLDFGDRPFRTLNTAECWARDMFLTQPHPSVH